MTFSYTLDRENRNLIIDEGSTHVPNSAFRSDNGFDTITFPESLTSIGTEAFAFSSVDSYVLPSSLEEIGQGAFNSTFSNNIDLVIPKGLTDIPRIAFQ